MNQLKYVKGDLIRAARFGLLNVIAHQANCFCKGRRGIAPQIFGTFPVAMRADAQTEIGDAEKMGNVSHGFHSFNVPNKDSLWVFNLYGQYHFDNNLPSYGTRYWALLNALEQMAKIITTRRSLYWKQDKVLRIGFPLIGCGLAGGDWNIVEEMILQTFKNVKNVELYCFTLEKLEDKDYVEIKSIGRT